MRLPFCSLTALVEEYYSLLRFYGPESGYWGALWLTLMRQEMKVERRTAKLSEKSQIQFAIN